MYTTSRNIAGATVMTCKDCGHAISMNKICEKPIQSATDMLKHVAGHNASRAFAAVERVMEPDPEVPTREICPGSFGIRVPLGSLENLAAQRNPLLPH